MNNGPDNTPDDALPGSSPYADNVPDAPQASASTPSRVQFIPGDVFIAPLPLHEFALVYADPPYAAGRFEEAQRGRRRQQSRGARADFLRALIARMESLRSETGVGAVTLSSPELRFLHLFPSTARVMAWVKPYVPPRPHVWPTYAWEPLVVWGTLPGRDEQRSNPRTPYDWVSASPRVARQSGFEAPKPLAFAEWVLSTTLGPRVGRVCELFAGIAPVARVAAERGCDSFAVDIKVKDYFEGVP